MKLTENQKKVIETMRKYPNDIVMFDGWMTGGHGVKFDLKTVDSLKAKGVIVDGKLSDVPRTCDVRI